MKIVARSYVFIITFHVFVFNKNIIRLCQIRLDCFKIVAFQIPLLLHHCKKLNIFYVNLSNDEIF